MAIDFTTQNTFEKGMVTDALPYLQPSGTYKYARNMVRGDRKHLGYGLSVEESNQKLFDITGVVGARYIESIDSTVFFVEGGFISVYNHKTKEHSQVANQDEFGCDWHFDGCEWIHFEAKTDQPCNDLKLYFSAGCEFFVINLTELQNPTRKQALIDGITSGRQTGCDLTCEHFKIMKAVCAPTVTGLASQNGGHKLVNGTYQFVTQLEDNGGNTTNWFTVSDPISVGSPNNQAGELSLGSIKVHITDLDCRYDKVNIAVIRTVEGVTTAKIVAVRHYSTDGITFTYVGQQEGRDVSLVEIQQKRKMYLKGRDVAQKDSRLFLYNIKQEKNLNMQRRVLEEATLDYIEIEVSPASVEKHGLRTLMRGENYMWGAVYNYIDQTHSRAFVMRPNSSCGGGAASSYSVTEPSGEGQKVTRPRGAPTGEGGTLGCSTGTCGGGGSTSTTSTRASNNGNTTNGVLENVQDWETEIDDMVEAAKCDDCQEPYCCDDNGGAGPTTCVDCGNSNNCEGCHKDEEAYAADLPKVQDIVGKHTDEMIYWNQDQDAQYDSYTLKTAAEKLVDSINNSEFPVIEKEKINITAKIGGSNNTGTQTIAPLPSDPVVQGKGDKNPQGETILTDEVTQATSSKAIWSDEYTDGRGYYLIDEVPVVTKCFAPKVVNSTETYPDSKDCNGEYYFGGYANTPVQLFRTPDAFESQIVAPTAIGVPSPHSSTDPLGAVKIRLLGVRANIPMPKLEDLPKPLCPNNPWTLVMIPRDEINSTVQAKGIMFGTFTGQSAGDTITFPRHGANSRAAVDRWIDNNGSRLGSSNGPGVVMYGLDTEIGKVGLSGRILRDETVMYGTGYRYNLYEKGVEPTEGFTGRRIDKRGATQYLNINVPQGPGSGESAITAVGYCNANAVTEVSGATNKVSTLNRESCVYIEAGLQPGVDTSFNTDTRDHSCPITAARGNYGAVVREIPDQYGAVTGMSFIKSGLEGRGDGTYMGIVGDSFIGPYSFIKKGFVSDKVGNTFPTPERERTVCDSANDRWLQYLGLDFFSTQLPLSGDRSDAKNWCGGHQYETWQEAKDHDPHFDYYYPKMVSTLITTWIESRINPYYRATGYGPAETNEIYWPKTKGHHLAASVGTTKFPWEKSYIDRQIRYNVEQPSVAQKLKFFFIKALVNLIMPMGFATMFGDITGVPDGVGTLMVSPILIAYWYSMKNLLTRGDYLSRMLGLPVCKTDAAGGETDQGVEDLGNNYYAYNYDHSALNYANVYSTIPTNYNTCSCDHCTDDDTTNEIFYSNKQIQGSPIDFYKQFGALSFDSIPADLGKLKKLFTVNGNFFAHTSDFIIPLKFKDLGVEPTTDNAVNGGFMVLQDPDSPIFEGVNEGSMGTTDPNASINTPYGYLTIDRESNKVFLFDGSSAPKVLSANGVDKMFKDYLNFCEIGKCHDEKVVGETFYSLGYDPRFNRVLLTKNEKNSDKSFTLSLDLGTGTPSWTSFHDYKPQHYIWDRGDLYTLAEGGFYLQNANTGTYREFYGEEYPSEIEFVAVSDGETVFNYIESFVNTEAEEHGTNKKNLDVSFTQVAVYNTTQGTGILPVSVQSDNRDSKNDMGDGNKERYNAKFHKVRRAFRLNNLKDYTIKTCKELAQTDVVDCYPIEDIAKIHNCEAVAAQDFKNRTIKDDHLTYRMTFNGGKNILLKLLRVTTHGEKDKR